MCRNFNPRSHKGSDLCNYKPWDSTIGFQSTLPQGERLVRETGSGRNSPFQSTLPQGERPRHQTDRFAVLYFNPRPHKGSDNQGLLWSEQEDNFNPRSHKGSDMRFKILLMLRNDFNPRSHKGSDIGCIWLYAPI